MDALGDCLDKVRVRLQSGDQVSSRGSLENFVSTIITVQYKEPTVVRGFFTYKMIEGGTVPVVPHKIVGQPRGGGGEGECTSHFHAVLIT